MILIVLYSLQAPLSWASTKCMAMLVGQQSPSKGYITTSAIFTICGGKGMTHFTTPIFTFRRGSCRNPHLHLATEMDDSTLCPHSKSPVPSSQRLMQLVISCNSDLIPRRFPPSSKQGRRVILFSSISSNMARMAFAGHLTKHLLEEMVVRLQ